MPPALPHPSWTRDADAALRTGRLADASRLYRASLAADPDQPNAWFNLAWVSRATRDFSGALAAYGEAIARGLAAPEDALVNRAAILSDHLFRPEDALAELDQALARRPAYLPALLGLGQVHEDRGDPVAAERAYRRAAAAEPGNGRAAARLAMLAIAGDDAGGAAHELTCALGAARSLDDRAEMLFALGDAFDRLQRYDDAFLAYEAANVIARARSQRYDPAAQERFVDRVIATFAQSAPQADLPDRDTPTPLFICGMFRSGSTLAERILSRHPDVAAAGELEFVPALTGRLPDYPESVPCLPEDGLAQWRADYRAILPRTAMAIDKRCDNFLHLGLIARLFPGSPIVHTQREPLDNLLSIYFLHFGEGIRYGQDLGEAAHFYIQYRRLMQHWERVGVGVIVDLDYDKLVASPRATLAPVVAALSLPWHDRLLEPEHGGGTIRTASAWQVRKPLHRASSGRWRHYERYLTDVRRQLAVAGI